MILFHQQVPTEPAKSWIQRSQLFLVDGRKDVVTEAFLAMECLQVRLAKMGALEVDRVGILQNLVVVLD